MKIHTLFPTFFALVFVLLSCSAARSTAANSLASSPAVAAVRGDGAVLLSAPPPGASHQNPAFSPDGRFLIFTRFANGYNIGPAGIFRLHLASGEIIRLTPVEDQDNVNLPGAAWNAVNDRIVFASDRLEADDLWRIAGNGSDFGRVTIHNGPPWYIEPSWSSDGMWIVFEADQAGVSEDGSVGEIWKVRADGTGLTQLTGGPGVDDRQPNWSPTGDRILFQRRTLPDGDRDIYTIAPDGSKLHNITNNPASDTDASWSPDGLHIVYSSDHGNLPVPNIFVIPASGGEPIRVTADATHEDGAPSWSPDGGWIVFESHSGQDEDTPASLWRISAPLSTPADKWSLWTRGVQLRGANIYQRRVYLDLDGEDFMGNGAVGPPYTQADFDRLAAMGANVVNISHPGLFDEDPPYALNPAIEQNLDSLLAMIAKADMFAIITFRTGPGRSEFWAFWGEDNISDPDDGWFPPSYYNNRVWNDQAAQDAWAAMWRYTAEKYKDNPIVIGYDLMCEPNSNEVGAYPDGPAPDIWDPQEFEQQYGGTLYDWNQFYPHIVAAIRQVDLDTPILVGGNGYSAVTWLPYLRPTDDPRTAYTVHQYAPMVYTHQEPPDLTYSYPGVFDGDEDGTPEQVNKAWLDNLLATVDVFTSTHHVPVTINEFGIMRWEPNAHLYIADETALFEQRGINTALWLWESSWPEYAAEVDAFNFRHGPDPNNHVDVPSSALMDEIKAYWSRNQVRPSTMVDATYYIRPDGGSAVQCNGLVDAPYPGSGTDQPCAWDHPFRALPPDGPARIRGGDTLIIGPGSYRMGYGAPEADGDGANCSSYYPWGCTMPPIPSGPDVAHPTRILGAGWDSGCADPPQLWGAERAEHILDLNGSRHVQIACLEITDHAGCAEFHSGGQACQRDSFPYGDWAGTGLYAQDAADVSLRDLNIHGFADAGIRAGRLQNWTLERVRLAGNGWVGWDGDIDGTDSNSGTMTFRRWTVEWNGCVETWPDEQPAGCWAQTAGGYGDGVGAGATGGDWIIEDSIFSHNTSDGLDLLYHSLGGSITLRRVRAEGNAGNSIKVTGETTMENSVLIANCAFFDGQPFTYNVDPCRALGNTFEATFMGGETVTLINNTFYGQGDGLVAAGPREGGVCNGNETLFGRNNLFLGDTDYFDPGDLTFLFYQEGCAGLSFDGDYNLYHRVKLSQYTPGSHDVAAHPRLAGPLSGQHWGMELTANSPAIDAGIASGAPIIDIAGHLRDARPDIGAYEWQGDPAATSTPTATQTVRPTTIPTPTTTFTFTPSVTPTTTPTPTASLTPTPTPLRLYLPVLVH